MTTLVCLLYVCDFYSLLIVVVACTSLLLYSIFLKVNGLKIKGYHYCSSLSELLLYC